MVSQKSSLTCSFEFHAQVAERTFGGFAAARSNQPGELTGNVTAERAAPGGLPSVGAGEVAFSGGKAAAPAPTLATSTRSPHNLTTIRSLIRIVFLLFFIVALSSGLTATATGATYSVDEQHDPTVQSLSEKDKKMSSLHSLIIPAATLLFVLPVLVAIVASSLLRTSVTVTRAHR